MVPFHDADAMKPCTGAKANRPAPLLWQGSLNLCVLRFFGGLYSVSQYRSSAVFPITPLLML
jgi:hypothetical protein